MNENKKNRLITALLGISLALNGCATMSDSLILGVGAGGTLGAVVASQNDSSSDKTNAGLAIGAALGGITAYFIHRGLESRDEKLRRETLLNLDKYDVSAPRSSRQPGSISTGGSHLLTKPSVDVEWVETRVDGDKLVEGHRVWRITEKSKWIPSDDSASTKEEK